MRGTRLSLLAVAAAGVLLAAGVVQAAGTPAGTVISNQASVAYTDVNGNPLSAQSNVVQTTVAQIATVLVDPDNTTSADPGDVVYFPHVVQNLGNAPDTIELAAVNGAGWTATLYLDANDNQIYDPGTDTLLTSSDGDGNPDSGLLAADGSVRILVAVTVPAGGANNTSSVTTVTGTSDFAPAVTESATDTITIQAPVLSVVKSVSPPGDQVPGTDLTYTMVLTNGGNGDAVGVVLRDPIPTNTTYQAGSITVDGAPRTDTNDGDGADYNLTNAGEVTVAVGTIVPAGSVTVTFTVRID